MNDLVEQSERAIRVRYKNWKGNVRVRTILPKEPPYWGSTEFHPEPQWLLPVLDLDEGVERDFALKDCDFLSENAR